MAMAEVRPKMRTRNSRGSTHSKSSKNQNQIAFFLQLVLKLLYNLECARMIEVLRGILLDTISKGQVQVQQSPDF